MPEGDQVETPPVCSCCRMRILRLTESTEGRVCPDCDRPGDAAVPLRPKD